jgi:hypothetical protein
VPAEHPSADGTRSLSCRDCGELGAGNDSQLAEGTREVGSHGSPGHEQSLPDLRIREPLGEKLDDLEFRGRQAVPPGFRTTTASPSSLSDAKPSECRADPGEIPLGPQLFVDLFRLSEGGNGTLRLLRRKRDSAEERGPLLRRRGMSGRPITRLTAVGSST